MRSLLVAVAMNLPLDVFGRPVDRRVEAIGHLFRLEWLTVRDENHHVNAAIVPVLSMSHDAVRGPRPDGTDARELCAGLVELLLGMLTNPIGQRKVLGGVLNFHYFARTPPGAA